MPDSLTLKGVTLPRVLSGFAGFAMIACAYLSMEHFFGATYRPAADPGSIWDISGFLSCARTAASPIAQVAGVPLGYAGLFMGALVLLGATFPSAEFERTNKALTLLNAIAAVALFGYSTAVLRTVCLPCAGYQTASLVSLVLFWAYGIDRTEPGVLRRWVRPSALHLIAFAVIFATGAEGMRLYHQARRQAHEACVAADGGVAAGRDARAR